MKVEYSDFDIDVTAELTDSHPKIYKDVIMTYTIRIRKEDQPKMERAVELSKERYCGVQEMFRSFSTVSSRIIFLD